jgi:hypothetical protein
MPKLRLQHHPHANAPYGEVAASTASFRSSPRSSLPGVTAEGCINWLCSTGVIKPFFTSRSINLAASTLPRAGG